MPEQTGAKLKEGFVQTIFVAATYLIKAAALAIAVVLGVVSIWWLRDNWTLQQQLEDDRVAAVITVPVGSAIDLNKIASAPLVCLFPPDYPVVRTLSRIFDQYRLGRSSEVRAEWVLASIDRQQQYINIAYLKGVKSFGSNAKGVPCGHHLLLDNSRFHDLDDINVSGFEFLLTHREIQCAASGKTITEERMIKEGCQ